MDGNLNFILNLPFFNVKIRPLMDGNLYYRYNHLLFYVKIRPLMDGNEVSEFELAKLELKSDH